MNIISNVPIEDKTILREIFTQEDKNGYVHVVEVLDFKKDAKVKLPMSIRYKKSEIEDIKSISAYMTLPQERYIEVTKLEDKEYFYLGIQTSGSQKQSYRFKLNYKLKLKNFPKNKSYPLTFEFKEYDWRSNIFAKSIYSNRKIGFESLNAYDTTKSFKGSLFKIPAINNGEKVILNYGEEDNQKSYIEKAIMIIHQRYDQIAGLIIGIDVLILAIVYKSYRIKVKEKIKGISYKGPDSPIWSFIGLYHKKELQEEDFFSILLEMSSENIIELKKEEGKIILEILEEEKGDSISKFISDFLFYWSGSKKKIDLNLLLDENVKQKGMRQQLKRFKLRLYKKIEEECLKEGYTKRGPSIIGIFSIIKGMINILISIVFMLILGKHGLYQSSMVIITGISLFIYPIFYKYPSKKGNLEIFKLKRYSNMIFRISDEYYDIDELDEIDKVVRYSFVTGMSKGIIKGLETRGYTVSNKDVLEESNTLMRNIWMISNK